MLKFVHRTLNQFINSQSLGGVVLALLLSNSPWSEAYAGLCCGPASWPRAAVETSV